MLAFVYLTTVLLMQNIPLNFATWALWVLIDTSLLVSMVKAGNKRPWIMIGFATGATTIALIALTKLLMGITAMSWGNPETLAAVAVAIALTIWKFTSNNAGVVSITVAMYVAMIPTLIDGWTKPVGQDPWFWGVCAIACLLTYIGSPKTIAGRFMPALGTFFNGLMAVLAFRQFFL